jgi:hypothetical protein
MEPFSRRRLYWFWKSKKSTFSSKKSKNSVVFIFFFGTSLNNFLIRCRKWNFQRNYVIYIFIFGTYQPEILSTLLLKNHCLHKRKFIWSPHFEWENLAKNNFLNIFVSFYPILTLIPYFFQDLLELFYPIKIFEIQFVCFPGKIANFKWRQVIFLENWHHFWW